MTRFFDILISGLSLLILFPFLLLISLWVVTDSPGGPIYKQMRVGRGGRPFMLWKFRTMSTGSDSKGQLTVGRSDTRITRAGGVLRRSKIDELPQLWNVLKGDMSIVGPRPEVPRYVQLYTSMQRKVLEVRPGLTDDASIAYRYEEDLLAKASDPETFYINEVMPEKIRLNMRYINDPSLKRYFKTIISTVIRIFS